MACWKPALVISALLIGSACAHSFLTEPQPWKWGACRLGNGGHCPGPCPSLTNRHNYGPSKGPAGVYKRGDVIKVKYARNNHAPGGFNRYSLVTKENIQNKEAHAKGAYYWSCWGAGVTVATQAEIRRVNGYNIVGDDFGVNGLVPAYYTDDVPIPATVPDGFYSFSQVWFGGTGVGPRMVRNHEVDGVTSSHFSDMYSCSWIEVRGGLPLSNSFQPYFNNTKSQFSQDGCMSAFDDIGQCPVVPCKGITGKHMKPKVFQNGKKPAPVTPRSFGYTGTLPETSTATTAAPTTVASTTTEVVQTTAAPEVTATPETTDAPDVTAAPEVTAAQEKTVATGVTAAAEKTAAAEVTAQKVTAAPEKAAAPEVTAAETTIAAVTTEAESTTGTTDDELDEEECRGLLATPWPNGGAAKRLKCWRYMQCLYFKRAALTGPAYCK